MNWNAYSISFVYWKAVIIVFDLIAEYLRDDMLNDASYILLLETVIYASCSASILLKLLLSAIIDALNLHFILQLCFHTLIEVKLNQL